jgi:tRNA(Ile)-lysidine synthase
MRGAHPERALEQAIVQSGIVREGEHIVVACSGGPDSVALSAALHAVAPSMRLTLSIAHVNHGLRASAWQDECIALRLAADCELPFDVSALVASEKHEAALREARYGALLDIARRRGADAVATAHHAEDQSETVLLALFRGAGPEGLGGIEPRRPFGEGIELIRPLLRVASGDLRYYCHVNGLPYAVDPTNRNPALRRNAVRAALEALRPAFPGLDEAVARAAALVAGELAGTPRAQLRRRVREALREQGELADVDFEHVEAAVRTLETGGTGRFHMKAGVTMRIERGGPAVMRSDED